MQHAPARELLHFIKNSPTCYHVTENIRQKLLANGYTELSERERWEVAPGGKYFVRRNGSSTIAFRVPEMIDGGFAMAAAHSDSPAFRLKEHPDRRSAHYVQLSTEKYGGMLMSTWFDRPLSVAGRVFVRANGEIVEKLVSVDRDLLVIPNVAIHMNRTANDVGKIIRIVLPFRSQTLPVHVPLPSTLSRVQADTGLEAVICLFSMGNRPHTTVIRKSTLIFLPWTVIFLPASGQSHLLHRISSPASGACGCHRYLSVTWQHAF